MNRSRTKLAVAAVLTLPLGLLAACGSDDAGRRTAARSS